MHYHFDAEERLVRRIGIDAPGPEAAVRAIRALYDEGVIRLDRDDDFEETSFTPVDVAAGDATVDQYVTVKWNRP